MGDKLRWLGRNAEEVVCAAMMTFMTALGFVNVAARYLGLFHGLHRGAPRHAAGLAHHAGDRGRF